MTKIAIAGGNDNYCLDLALANPDSETNFAEALPSYGVVLLMQETSHEELVDLNKDLPLTATGLTTVILTVPLVATLSAATPRPTSSMPTTIQACKCLTLSMGMELVSRNFGKTPSPPLPTRNNDLRRFRYWRPGPPWFLRSALAEC